MANIMNNYKDWCKNLFNSARTNQPRKAICVVNRSKDFERLIKVLIKSWEAHNDMPLEFHYMNDGWNRKYLHGLWVNTIKLEKWADLFRQDTLFLDADLLCKGDMSEPFDVIENLGYTENRARGRILNAGVFYAKSTKYSRKFMAEWVAVNRKMLNSRSFHAEWRRKYMGINQAALGYLMENGWELTKLPEKYNLCDWTERKVKKARMIHIKSDLRKNILLGTNKYPYVTKIWEKYEA